MTDLNTITSALVASTWAAWAVGDSPDYIAVLKQHGIEAPAGTDPNEFGLFDSLELIGLGVSWSPDYVGLDVRALDSKTQAELDELLA